MIAVHLQRADDFAEWRDRARDLLRDGVAPDRVLWTAGEADQGLGQGGDLFAGDLFAVPAPASPEPEGEIRVSREFIAQAKLAILHRDPNRFALLYRLLWRSRAQPRLLANAADPDVHALAALLRQVRRDIHKMRAFVRFRLTRRPDAGGNGAPFYVAWFEPDYFTLRHNAKFFINRFGAHDWAILTPDLTLVWQDGELREEPGARKEDAPAEDTMSDLVSGSDSETSGEALWNAYYAAIFNPARLKTKMMVREMPRRYWKNLPEARLIPDLIAGAQAREAAMVDAGADRFDEPAPQSLAELAQRVSQCRRCAIGCNGTTAVTGEGASMGGSGLMILGEQPGDNEELAGRPFVGPAGQVLDTMLGETGIDRGRAWLTNAVKHFKFEQVGKRRLHQSPTAGEIDMCRWWLDHERRLVTPGVILALGASAARAVLGRTPSIQRERGQVSTLADGSRLIVTTHPSYLLRSGGEPGSTAWQAMLADVALAGEVLEEVQSG
ncbi:UdgX family uracil-DNA binding protein [Altererythrobacter xixiisoli]|uniref:Type-4 uracil-DNA glycosylase n=2 Tax=Croceibacterium xixiisoli TaxID=1476466 RepID=A0A6I4TY75_9SPHN|nr:UdgX family uracil-DNA binding protein [Croceibacterium xixiisoli]